MCLVELQLFLIVCKLSCDISGFDLLVKLYKIISVYCFNLNQLWLA